MFALVAETFFTKGNFKMKNFRTFNLAVEFYKESRALQLDCHLKMQLARAASSIVLNLAEGSGRRTPKDQARFFQIAFGSLRESQAILELADSTIPSLKENADKLAAHIYQLIKKCNLG